MSGHESPTIGAKICMEDCDISLHSYVCKTNNSEKTSMKFNL